MSGFGTMTLGNICSEYDLMFQVVRQSLSESGLEAESGMTVKEIAANNDKNPMDIFELLHGIVNEKQKK